MPLAEASSTARSAFAPSTNDAGKGNWAFKLADNGAVPGGVEVSPGP